MNATEIEWIHDLRMPLQIIESSAQLLKLSREDPTLDAAGYVDMLMDSVFQMRRMLDDAMEACGRDARREPARLRNGDIAACVREWCRRCAPYAEKCGASLVCSGNVDSLMTAFDEDRLSRVLLNLIFNALRAAGPGGHVRVSWTALGDACEIAVTDDGGGIPADRLPWIFLRGESDGGHGYGLSSARECARAMGGELTARSEAGRGSAFTLRLPVRAAMVS